MIVTTTDMQRATDLAAFVQRTVADWRGSAARAAMAEARAYYWGENPALARSWNRIVLDTGAALDLKPRQSVHSNFFGRLVKQLVNRLLYYDVSVEGGGPRAARVAADAPFQAALREAAYEAAITGVAWGLWENGRLMVMPAEQFIPIMDEESGALAAGIRFWQLRPDLPLRYQLFEPDGVTGWTCAGKGSPMLLSAEKTPYRFWERRWLCGKTESGPAGDAGSPVLPIVPCYANKEHRSELTLPIQSKINAFDFLATFYTDEFLQSKFVYWMIGGYSGDVEELVKIRDTVRRLGIIAGDAETRITPTTLEPPHAAHEQLMRALRRGIYEDAMLFDANEAVAASSTATAVMAAQHAEDVKVRGFAHEVELFVRGILRVAGARGVDSARVLFKHFRLMDAESVTRRLTMLHGMGVPLEALTVCEPLLQEGRV